jgi:hypothetical protein
MLSIRNILFLFSLTLFLSSCGLVQKTRYGNGLKLDVWNKSAQGFDSAKLAKLRASSKTQKKRLNVEYKNQKETGSDNYNQLESVSQSQKTRYNWHEMERESKLNDVKAKKEIEFTQVSVEEPPLPYEEKKSKGKLKDGGVEPHAKWAGITFVGSFVASILGSALGVSSVAAAVSLGIALSVLGVLASLVALILAIIAVVNIRQAKQEGIQYRGLGIAVAIIVLNVLSLFVTFLFLLFLLLLL